MDEHAIGLVRHRVHPALRGTVAGVVGLREEAPGEVHRRQPAGTLVPLVVSWNSRLTIDAPSGDQGTHTAFVAGLMPGYTDTVFRGARECVQVFLTPLGVQRVLGVPGREVARRVTALGDVAPALGADLGDHLASAGTWRERFALVDDALLRLTGASDPSDPLVTWLWHRISASGGRLRVAELAASTGWSHRYVTERFEALVGLTPKAAAQVVRFERALADLGRRPLADLAVAHGYADQSHLTREFGRYAGATPGGLMAAPAVPTPHAAIGQAPGRV
ncbi:MULTISPECIES: helix-turn-helix transcriptional regulator [unclassified Actinotalea]|uniref:helix-turn-helix transcriptional regulator n=1 Tax=unclassified Actinotalea TaxID=2638618 RepID=UPI0015F77BE7|nr:MULTISPECIES: helix-turn-helix transcriptional regulator [unclassified Actinotalea]